jgi:K+-transporting ATPase KdpF subunit
MARTADKTSFSAGVAYAGHSILGFHDRFLHSFAPVCLGLRPAQVGGFMSDIILLVISSLTVIYLLAALLWPERF